MILSFANNFDGAAWLSMVRHGSVCCGVAQLVARRLAERQARVRFSARHHREAFPTELSSDEEMEEAFPPELSSDEEMERGPGEWRRIYVLYECD